MSIPSLPWKTFLILHSRVEIFTISNSVDAHAAELVMFEQTGCARREPFEREIAPIYPKIEERKRDPLRRECLMPLFMLANNGRAR